MFRLRPRKILMARWNKIWTQKHNSQTLQMEQVYWNDEAGKGQQQVSSKIKHNKQAKVHKQAGRKSRKVGRGQKTGQAELRQTGWTTMAWKAL